MRLCANERPSQRRPRPAAKPIKPMTLAHSRTSLHRDTSTSQMPRRPSRHDSLLGLRNHGRRTTDDGAHSLFPAAPPPQLADEIDFLSPPSAAASRPKRKRKATARPRASARWWRGEHQQQGQTTRRRQGLGLHFGTWTVVKVYLRPLRPPRQSCSSSSILSRPTDHRL